MEEKTIAIELLNVVKLMKNTYITTLELNPKHIEISRNL
jgi:hypothetical protein